MLLERDAQLRQLREALAQARRGRGRTVLVSGDAGIGKTSLLRAFTAEAGDARLLVGSCEDLLTPRTFGPFRDMLRDAGLMTASMSASSDRDAYLEAFLSEMSFTQRPTVVMVDDAQWADDASIDIIRYLARRIDRLPAVLVVAYRDRDLASGHPLRRVLGVLTGPSTRRLRLPPLSDAAVTHLADQAGVDSAPLIAAVGGNPFYLTEVLASTGTGVPETVRDAVLSRVRALPEPTIAVLQLISVVPHPVDSALVIAVLGSTSGIAAAESAGMLSVLDGRIQFRHELARRAVEESLSRVARVELHLSVLEWLAADADAEPSRLVHHAVAAGDPRGVATFAPIAAGEAAAAEAHSETLAFARLGLEHEQLLDQETQAQLHGLAAQALYALTRFGEASRHAETAVELSEGQSPSSIGRSLLTSSRMHTMTGEPALARAEIDRALLVLEPLGGGPVLAHACAMMGNLEAIESEWEQASAWSQRAIELADVSGSRDVEALARIYLGMAKIGLRDLSGFDDLNIAIDRAQQLDHGDYLCRAAINVAIGMIWLGRHSGTSGYLDIAEHAAREHRLDYLLFHVVAQRSHVDLYLGNWAAAERQLRSLLGTDRDPAAVLVLPLALLGRLLARRGDPAAGDLVARSWEVARQSRQVHRMAIAGGAMIEAAWLRGDHETVRVVAKQLQPIALRANLTYLHGETLRYLCRVGGSAESVRAHPAADIPAGFAAGIIGDWQAAATAWAQDGNPYEEALELTESPDPEVAFGGLRRLDDLGATATAGLVRRSLRRKGFVSVPRGPRTATRKNPGGLTPRQLDILILLDDGLTSTEIAERLFLSRRTVDNHVASILDRLGVTTRSRAVATARAKGLLDSSSG